MMQRLRTATCTLASCGLLFAAGTLPAFAGDPTGDWRVADGVANIRIQECHDRMWGAVSWEKVPGGRDSNNPDRTKQSRPTLGMPVLLSMKKDPDEQNKWTGKVYNAKDGKTYDSNITLESPNKLEIEGCVLGFLCGGETWTRVSGPIPSSPSNSIAEAEPRTGTTRGTPSKTGAHAAAKHTGKTSSRTVGQHSTPPAAAAADASDQVGDICLLPDIARATH